MRRDRIIARILLFFTVANVTLAAPAVVRQRHLDVTEAARKRGNAGSQLTVSGQTSSGSSDSFWDPYHPPSDSEDEVQSQAESNPAHLVSESGSQVRPNSEDLVSVLTSESGSQVGPNWKHLVSDAESQVGTNPEHLVSDAESQIGSNPEHPDSDRESLSGGLAHNSPPELNGVITDDLTQELKKVSIWGAIAAFSAGVTYKILRKTGFSYVSALFPSPTE